MRVVDRMQLHRIRMIVSKHMFFGWWVVEYSEWYRGLCCQVAGYGIDSVWEGGGTGGDEQRSHRRLYKSSRYRCKENEWTKDLKEVLCCTYLH
jgi:hypothetical protein